jgi:hypothetical protein
MDSSLGAAEADARMEVLDACREVPHDAAEPGLLRSPAASATGALAVAVMAAGPLCPGLRPFLARSLSQDLKRSSTMVRCWSESLPSMLRAAAGHQPVSFRTRALLVQATRMVYVQPKRLRCGCTVTAATAESFRQVTGGVS